MNYKLDQKYYSRLARQTAAEGCVLLKNSNTALPLRQGDHVAVFGRAAFEYHKSGLGSGGMVNTTYTTNILDSLEKSKALIINQDLKNIYQKWLEANPAETGKGWGEVPSSQPEMIPTEQMLAIAETSDACLVIIGRVAGEDQDLPSGMGGYQLTFTEKQLIQQVSSRCKRTTVVLNTGGILDMSWEDSCSPSGILYAWYGGQEGGNGTADVLLGKISPCGKLTDTIADEYPSDKNFGNSLCNYYEEDIYVGYRYFETFHQKAVRYPFGYGCSYTTFSVSASDLKASGTIVSASVSVKNTGSIPGKEVIQIYVQSPQGQLGTPLRRLIGFQKTKELAPGEEQMLHFEIPKYVYAVYDDSGKTGYKFSYLLEAGEYKFYIGTDVRSAALAGKVTESLIVMETSETRCAPVKAFQRFRPQWSESSNKYEPVTEAVPLRSNKPSVKICPEFSCMTDQKLTLKDVRQGKASLKDLVAQISEKDLMAMFYGEGMCSTKVTPGTASAFGGVTNALAKLDIPVACCSDGPSGIRMDCGTTAFSLPCGTMIGCTWNEQLTEELFSILGLELRLNKIDMLLGPGINIHRHPRNGRNFEYLSEDPLLTGKLAAAEVRGMASYGSHAVLKHFCANNQELGRRTSDSVVSERALREIYLKSFEIAVKEGNAKAVMTSYGAVNGIWTAGNYDLCTGILREEWGFQGIVMTDWWAEANYEGESSHTRAKAPMVFAQNDLYMCVPDASVYGQSDDLCAQYYNGYITKAQLQRNAENILSVLMNTTAMQRLCGEITEEEKAAIKSRETEGFSPDNLAYYYADENDTLQLSGKDLNPSAQKADVFGIVLPKMGIYQIKIIAKSDLNELAQIPVSVFYDNTLKMTIVFRGSNGIFTTETRDLGMIFGSNHFIKLYYGAAGLDIDSVEIKLVQEVKPDFL